MKSTSSIQVITFSDPKKQAAFEKLPEIENPQGRNHSLWDVIAMWSSLDAEFSRLSHGSDAAIKKMSARDSYDRTCQRDFGISAIEAFNKLPESHRKFMTVFPHGS